MMKLFFRLALWLIALAPCFARAGGDQVVVIYNKNVSASRTVARYYAKMRHVPSQQVWGFSLPDTEVMSRDDFKSELQLPLAEKLQSAGLWKFGETTIQGADGTPVHFIRCVTASKIRYAVLCFGVPLRIAEDPDIREPENKAVPELFQGNGASVDSELAWLPLIENDERLSGPMMNRLYGCTNAALLDPTNGILLVARLDGPSPDIAMGLVKKSIEAEQNGLWGRSYFDARGITQGAYRLGDEWILGSAKLCKAVGFGPVVDTNPATFQADFPMSQIAIYAGWYSENADGPFAQPTVEFMPGAFAYHLHSFSAATLRSTTQHWCGPLLAKGAACTMGCVNEPSIQFTPNVQAFLARWIVDGFTFGQAAWAAQPALSWQTTVIGDPLYRPFAKSASQLFHQLKRSHSPDLQWYYWRVANFLQARGMPLVQVENYLENLPLTDTSAVLTEKLGDLCDLQGKPDSAIEFYQRALKLGPSPEQRIHIRLDLAARLLAQNQTAKAIADYRAILEEAPGYPGDSAVSNKIAALGQKISAK
ncbi:MAG: TIGR03790 family protein [Limisphaerales bacterium]